MNARPLFRTDVDFDRAVERVALAGVEQEKVDAVARAVRVEREAWAKDADKRALDARV